MTGKRGKQTLAHVAELAGVSIGTASSVFNGRGPVSPATAAAVRNAAAEIGYKPVRERGPQLPADATLANVGLLGLPDDPLFLSGPYYGPLLAGVEKACAGPSIGLTYETGARADDGGLRVPRCVVRRQVSGLILVGGANDAAFVARMLEAGLACVLVDHTMSHLPVDSVRHDDEGGGYAATRHLIDHGHVAPVPATITGPMTAHTAQGRLAGYLRALREAGLTAPPEYIQPSTYDPPSGAAAMTALLDLPTPPTAVFCGNDGAAMGAVSAVRARGLRVPQDVSVVGFNNEIPVVEYSQPPLTSVTADTFAMGLQAGRHLLERLEAPDTPGRETRIAVRLVERQSVARR